MPIKQETSEVRRKDEFIKSKQSECNVRMMRRLLNVAEIGHYAWFKIPVSNHAREDVRLPRLIRASFNDSQCVYGAPRVFLNLREAGESCSKHRVSRLIREDGMRAQPGYRTRRYIAGKPAELIPNLVKLNFDISQPNKVWVADITYVRPWGSSLYVAVVLDLFSRKVLGWAARPKIHCELALDAILMVVRMCQLKDTMIHSDQGSHCSRDDWHRFCSTNNLEPSMSRRGNYWDHAVVECFSSSLKKSGLKNASTRLVKTFADISKWSNLFYNSSGRRQNLSGLGLTRMNLRPQLSRPN